MDKIATLVSLNELRSAIDELTERVRGRDDSSGRKMLIVALSVIGALVLVGIVAYLTYSRLAGDDYYDDYEDFDDYPDEDGETLTIVTETDD